MIEFYNSQVADFDEFCRRESVRDRAALVDTFIDSNPAKISWSSSLVPKVARGVRLDYNTRRVTDGAYRPFNRQRVYFGGGLSHREGSLAAIFPTPDHPNIGFYVVGMGSDKPFSALATDVIPDLAFWGSSNGQFFPRWTYEPVESTDTQGAFDLSSNQVDGVAGYRRVDNIADEALAEYRTTYGPAVAKDDVFYYTYGLLHSPDYRTLFATDLKKMLPRIPKVASVEDFRAFAAAGRELATLHIGYESVQPYPMSITGDRPAGVGSADLYDWYRVEKMRFGGAGAAKDRSTVVYNSRISVAGIPGEAHEYLLGSRSAIQWILERYQVKTDKASGIVNDPNDWSREVGEPRYILDLLARVVTVSVETVRIVKSLPPIDFSGVRS
jgi:predicted helicase